MKGHEQDDAICLSWRLFGSSGVEFDGRNYSVLERFKMRQVGFNQHIKVVLNLDRVRCADGQLFKCPHFASGVVAKSVDGRAIVGPFDM